MITDINNKDVNRINDKNLALAPFSGFSQARG